MARAIFRLRLPDGTVRLACGSVDDEPYPDGPADLLPPETTVESLLGAGVGAIRLAARAATGVAVPEGSVLLAPIDTQEVWGAGVT